MQARTGRGEGEEGGDLGRGRTSVRGGKEKLNNETVTLLFSSSFAQGRANLYLMKSWMWGEGYRKKKKWEMICSAHRKRKKEENQDTPSFKSDGTSFFLSPLRCDSKKHSREFRNEERKREIGRNMSFSGGQKR